MIELDRGWTTDFQRQIPIMGHRNWVIVADAAFPALCAPGNWSLVSKHSLPATVSWVRGRLEESGHVRPVAVLDAEFQHLTEKLCPGASALQAELGAALEGLEQESVFHEHLLLQLSDIAKKYTVLMIKTPCRIPYSSVFFRLECGYWGSTQESALRTQIQGDDQP